MQQRARIVLSLRRELGSASRSSFFWALTAEHSLRRPAEGLGQGALASAVAVLAFGFVVLAGR